MWAGLAALAAGAWIGVGRPVSRVMRLAEAEFRVPEEITEEHIAWFRELRIGWAFLIEGGGPMVDPAAPYGPKRGMPRLALHREVCDLLVWLLANRPLEPGSYPMAHLDAVTREAILRVELAALPAARIEAVLAEGAWPMEDGRFAFSDQHSRLLPGLAWQWPGLDIAPLLTRRAMLGAPVPAVDFKRPFGDATAFHLDMADLVGLPSVPEDPSVLFSLYEELWPALQVYVQNVPLEEGPLHG